MSHHYHDGGSFSSGNWTGLRDERQAAADLAAERKAIYEWAHGDPLLLSARCVKAEEALESARRLLLHIEGAFLGYWTDIPQETIQSILPRIREELGAYEPRS